jgi:predicted phosphodiesterase
MELLMKKRYSLLIAISVALASCTKTENDAETSNQRFIQSMDWNETHSSREIVVPSDDYSILSTGDIHVGGSKNLDHFISIAKERNASAVVMAGDLTTGNSGDYQAFDQHIQAEDSIPLFLVAGNHDLHYNGWKEFYNRFGSSTYTFSIRTPVSTDLCICLETGGGTLGNRQLEWLTNLLQTSRSDYRRCIVFTHNNFFRTRHTDSTNPVVEELSELLTLFTENHVDMVVTGHDHRQDAVEFGLTTYIVMDALKDGLENAGYFDLRVKDGVIAYKFETIY